MTQLLEVRKQNLKLWEKLEDSQTKERLSNKKVSDLRHELNIANQAKDEAEKRAKQEATHRTEFERSMLLKRIGEIEKKYQAAIDRCNCNVREFKLKKLRVA